MTKQTSKIKNKPSTDSNNKSTRKAKSMQSYRLQAAKSKQKLAREKIKFKQSAASKNFSNRTN